MTSTVNQDPRWSDIKNVEGQDGLITLDCLRGRLLAERQASKVAKEDAELVGNKLIELENKLKQESKLRKKAEKKLKFLVKKLECLKISPNLEGLAQSSSSENCRVSCTSSASSSVSKDHEESEYKSQSIIPEVSQDIKDNIPIIPESIEKQSNLPIEESSSTLNTSDSNSCHSLKAAPLSKSSFESTPSFRDSKSEHNSSSSLKSSVVERAEAIDVRDNEDYVDNSLALVPVSVPESTKTIEVKINDKTVGEVLDALRRAREDIKSKMEIRRHMIRLDSS